MKSMKNVMAAMVMMCVLLMGALPAAAQALVGITLVAEKGDTVSRLYEPYGIRAKSPESKVWWERTLVNGKPIKDVNFIRAGDTLTLMVPEDAVTKMRAGGVMEHPTTDETGIAKAGEVPAPAKRQASQDTVTSERLETMKPQSGILPEANAPAPAAASQEAAPHSGTVLEYDGRRGLFGMAMLVAFVFFVILAILGAVLWPSPRIARHGEGANVRAPALSSRGMKTLKGRKESKWAGQKYQLFARKPASYAPPEALAKANVEARNPEPPQAAPTPAKIVPQPAAMNYDWMTRGMRDKGMTPVAPELPPNVFRGDERAIVTPFKPRIVPLASSQRTMSVEQGMEASAPVSRTFTMRGRLLEKKQDHNFTMKFRRHGIAIEWLNPATDEWERYVPREVGRLILRNPEVAGMFGLVYDKLELATFRGDPDDALVRGQRYPSTEELGREIPGLLQPAG